MTPINYRKTSPASKKAWFTFKDNHRGEELQVFSFMAGWNASKDQPTKVAPRILDALQKAEALLDGPIADLLTGDQMSEAGAYDVLNSIRSAIAEAK